MNTKYPVLLIFHENKAVENTEILQKIIKQNFPSPKRRILFWEHYIAVYDQPRIDVSSFLLNVYIVSAKTLELVRSLAVLNKKLEYKQGLVVIGGNGVTFGTSNIQNSIHFNIIFQNIQLMFRILGVASGTYFHDVHLTTWRPRFFHWSSLEIVTMNDKYIVFVNEIEGVSIVKIYDLRAIKDPNADPKNLLLTEFKVNKL